MNKFLFRTFSSKFPLEKAKENSLVLKYIELFIADIFLLHLYNFSSKCNFVCMFMCLKPYYHNRNINNIYYIYNIINNIK